MAARLTRALVKLHGAGRADAYRAALLDVAQDHLLAMLSDEGFFDDGRLIFKGGTSLRKCRLGNTGRFSTDLDFCAPDEEVVLDVCAAIDGALLSRFEFSLESTRGDGRHWALRVRHDELGSPDLGAAVEFARRPLIRAPERLSFVSIPVHRAYGFGPGCRGRCRCHGRFGFGRRSGRGGMIGGLLTAGTLATAGGGGIAIGLAAPGTAAAAVEAVVAMHLTAAILRELQGIPQDPNTRSSLAELESAVARQLARLKEVSDESAPTLKELQRKRDAIDRALDYLNSHNPEPEQSALAAEEA